MYWPSADNVMAPKITPIAFAELANFTASSLLAQDTKDHPNEFDLMNHKYFVVVSLARNGGKWLADMLTQRPDVAVKDELLRVYGSGGADMFNMFDPLALFVKGKKADGVEPIPGNLRKFQGFVWKEGDGYNITGRTPPEAFGSLLKGHNFYVILLERKNLLAREVALSKHRATGLASCLDTVCARTEQARRITIPTNGLAQKLASIKSKQNAMSDYIKARISPQRVMSITFEDLQSSPKHVVSRVLDFLGASPLANLDALVVDSSSHRMSAEKISSSLFNADEVRLAIKDEEWAEALRD